MDIGVEGGNVVFVKVRETYDLHTTKNKMTVIGIHTPKPEILRKNFPGLLMQCKAYRPVSADVRIACASMLPLDPQGVGTSPGDVAPEDVFNPLLYKAMSNLGMSQLEARIHTLKSLGGEDVSGNTAIVDVDSVTPNADEFNIYYGLLSDAHGWRHASPQSGLEMKGLRPLVYEMLYNVGDNVGFSQSLSSGVTRDVAYGGLDGNGDSVTPISASIRGNGKPLPFINCTSYTFDADVANTSAESGFKGDTGRVFNAEIDTPYINVIVGCIIVPPSRLHELFYRMVVEWTIEFSQIRTIGEITNWAGLARIGQDTHYQNYSYAAAKEAITGDPTSMLDSDSCMVSANVEVDKVM